MTAALLPSARALALPQLSTIITLGGSATISEITEAVAKHLQLSEEQQAVPRGQGRTELEYRLAWSRTKLKLLGFLNNSQAGVWSVTDLGGSSRWSVTAGSSGVVVTPRSRRCSA